MTSLHQWRRSARSEPMPRTIQCQRCGVVLNLPAHVAGGQATEVPEMRDSVRGVGSDASSMSTVPGLTDAALTSFDLDKRPPSPDDLPIADVRRRLARHVRLAADERTRRRARPGGFAAPRPPTRRPSSRITGPSKRRLAAAEARARARRCVHCGSGVPQGMSICPTCGTDQETGMRVGLEDDLAPPPPPRPQGPPLHIAIIGGLCGTAGIILMLAGAIKSTQGQSSARKLCVARSGPGLRLRHLRLRSVDQGQVRQGAHARADARCRRSTCSAWSLFRSSSPCSKTRNRSSTDVKPKDLDESGVEIKPFEERINTQRIELGVVVIVIYAVLSLYLMSPPVKKYIFRCRPDRVPVTAALALRLGKTRHRRDSIVRSESRPTASCVIEQFRRSRYRAGCARSAPAGRGRGRRRAAVLVDAMKPSSSDAAAIPVWPISSRTRAGCVSVRCLRLSFSGSTREFLPSIWISQRSSSTQIPSSRGSAHPDCDRAACQLG